MRRLFAVPPPPPIDAAAAEAGIHGGRFQELRRGDHALISRRVEVVQHVGDVYADGQVEAMRRAVSPTTPRPPPPGPIDIAPPPPRPPSTPSAATPATSASATGRRRSGGQTRPDAEYAIDAQVHRNQTGHGEIVARHQIDGIGGIVTGGEICRPGNKPRRH